MPSVHSKQQTLKSLFNSNLNKVEIQQMRRPLQDITNSYKAQSYKMQKLTSLLTIENFEDSTSFEV